MKNKNRMVSNNPLISRLYSFKYSISGIKYMLTTQKNALIHLLAAMIVVVFGIIYHIDKYEWCLIIFAIGMVFVSELFNTSIEFLTDLLAPEFNQKAGKAKDIAAGAVLIAATIAVLAGLIIFIPKIFP
jgi:diacylglycerol kinase